MHLFEQNIIQLYGKKGALWLKALPSGIAHIALKTGLSNLEPFENLTYHYVLSGLQNTLPIILKVDYDPEALKKEVSILNAFSGFGVARVLLEGEGWFIQERVLPGNSLKSFFPNEDETAIGICAELIKRLHQAPLPKNASFPHIKDWLSDLDKTWAIPLSYLQLARKMRDTLLKNAGPDRLLHGDLHHDNILHLKTEDICQWRAIDPKGVIGESAYEVAAFIRNPILPLLEQNEALSIIQKRIAQFSHLLDIPSVTLSKWCFVQAVLAWIWALQDQENIIPFNKLTLLFKTALNSSPRA